jgi:hypothetical protein
MVSLKKWLDSHPGPTVLGIAISVATTTAAITTYFADQLHKAETAQIESKRLVEVSDLRTRLSSIERRAGSDQSKLYLDVQSMQVSPSEIRNLPSQFNSFDDGSFFLNAPISQDWSYDFMSYAEVAKLGVFKSLVDLSNNAALAKVLERKRIHVWYSKPAAEIKYAIDQGDLKLGTLTPYVKIQKVTQQDFAPTVTDVRSKAKKDAGTAIAEIERLKEGDPGVERTVPTDVNSRATGIFENAFEDDRAGTVFMDTLVQNWLLPQIGPYISLNILSAQKQFNVMYADIALRLLRTNIEKSYDQTCKEGSSATVVIRREIFFVSYGRGGYLISSEVPTCDGRSKAFEWISEWLLGLKFVKSS